MPDAEPTLDLVTINRIADDLIVRLGDGLGGFGGGLDLEVGGGYRQVALGDLDGDGDLALVMPLNFGEGVGDRVNVRLNDGGGSFGSALDVAVTDAAGDIALGDLDGDGDLDVATANYDDGDGNGVSLRLNDGDGTFREGSEVVVGDGPTEVALGDLDGDGDLDLAAANTNGGTVSLRLNDGNGTFGGGSEVEAGSTPTDLALGDIDGDGDLDLSVG